jgi:hypothetical protein
VSDWFGGPPSLCQKFGAELIAYVFLVPVVMKYIPFRVWFNDAAGSWCCVAPNKDKATPVRV